MEQDVLEKFKLPLCYDNSGQFILDADNKLIAQIRSFGYLQKFPNPELMQDTLGEMIAKAFNEKYNHG